MSAAPPPNLSRKGVERGHRRTSPGSLQSSQTSMSWGLGLLGRTRKPRGRVRLSISRVLVGPGMMHAPTPVARLKTKQRARQHAPHDSSNINQIRVFEHPITRPTRTGRANAHEPYQRWLWAWLPPFLFPPRSRFSCSPLPQCRLSQDARVLPLSSGTKGLERGPVNHECILRGRDERNSG